MRAFSSAVKTILASGQISVFRLVEILSKGGTLRDTTAPYAITIPSLGTFSPNTGLLIVEGPRQSSAVDRETYKITYIDPEMEKRTLFEAGFTGTQVNTYVGFFNPFSYVLGGANPGQPLTNAEDIIIAYSGVADTQGYSISPEDGTVIAVIECSSPMASLGMLRQITTSKDFMKGRDPTDTAFDQVSINAAKTTFLWGKS